MLESLRVVSDGVLRVSRIIVLGTLFALDGCGHWCRADRGGLDGGLSALSRVALSGPVASAEALHAVRSENAERKEGIGTLPTRGLSQGRQSGY
jgi:hypothetical protein